MMEHAISLSSHCHRQQPPITRFNLYIFLCFACLTIVDLLFHSTSESLMHSYPEFHLPANCGTAPSVKHDQHDAPDYGRSKKSIGSKVTPKKAKLGDETSVIITSNSIPTHPSLSMINSVVSTLERLKGLSPTARLIISVDGVNGRVAKNNKKTIEESNKVLQEYVRRLRAVYNATHQTILVADGNVGITGVVKQAMDVVQTEFVYVIQHDMPFLQDINHTGIIRAMEEYPDTIRLVRFNRKKNFINFQRKPGEPAWKKVGDHPCYNEPSPTTSNTNNTNNKNKSNNNDNGIQLIKTPLWSDKYVPPECFCNHTCTVCVFAFFDAK